MFNGKRTPAFTINHICTSLLISRKELCAIGSLLSGTPPLSIYQYLKSSERNFWSTYGINIEMHYHKKVYFQRDSQNPPPHNRGTFSFVHVLHLHLQFHRNLHVQDVLYNRKSIAANLKWISVLRQESAGSGISEMIAFL